MSTAAVVVHRTSERFMKQANYNPPPAKIDHRPAACSSCSLREMCLPGGMKSTDVALVDDLIYTHRRMKRGDVLYRAGMPFEFLYAVHSGFFKSYALAEDGREQVTGFQMAGDMIGLDSIEADVHGLTVEALDDSVVCVIPFTKLERMTSRFPSLQRQLYRMMSREIVRDQAMMMLLGSMHAEGRVAAFMLSLSERFVARGYAASEFNLRMTREEIGSYLGLKLETVSRVFSRLQQLSLIEVEKRRVRICDLTALKGMLGRAV